MSDGLWDEEQTPPEREATPKPRGLGGATKSRRDRGDSRPLIRKVIPGTDVVGEFVGLVRCASCGQMVPGGPAPVRHKATEWLALAADHAPDCQWIATRGYTDR